MIQLIDLHKTFKKGTPNEKVALNGLNLTLEDGDFVTVIGGNGSGKSTTLNAIAGVWQLDSGRVVIDGVDVTNVSEHKRAKWLGRVFQDPSMGTAPNMMIEENLALAYRRGKKRGLGWGITPQERAMYRDMLSRFGLGLEDRLSTKVKLLSGGQRQAVTLLMATMNNPEVLLLDEHTAALDPSTSKKVLELTDKIVEENHLTTLMITHNMTDALKHGNRLVMINNGQVVLDVRGEEKKQLTVQKLLEKFDETALGNL